MKPYYAAPDGQTIYVGDVRDVLRGLPDESVQMCVTSPPYWGLRSYGIGVENGEIGLEPTPAAYVATMVSVFREIRRVLRGDGVVFGNWGDSYAHNGACGGGSPDGPRKPRATDRLKQEAMNYRVPPGLKPKDLCMIPARVAMALQADGWWLRSDIIWAKRAPMPESVTDRPTSAYEHVFLLTKSANYWYDADAVREPLERIWDAQTNGGSMANGRFDAAHLGNSGRSNRPYPEPNPAGRNQRNFWLLGPEPYAEAHFATFPTEIPRRAILAGTSEAGCCPKCGRAWVRRIMATAPDGRRAEMRNGKAYDDSGKPLMGDNMIDHGVRGSWNSGGELLRRETLGFRAACKCDAGEPVPCTILDPFLGSGTSLLVARQLGRAGIGIELNPTYADLAINRLEGQTLSMFALEA